MAFNRQSTEIHRVPQAWHSVFFWTLTGCQQQQDTRYFFLEETRYVHHTPSANSSPSLSR